ncbi:MAG: hypothetical protein EPO00_03905 [Chloroflexota bacterium]|nr:MAG: hypothetical protein EPO00_03905 [Chloroflexota bacterium]
MTDHRDTVVVSDGGSGAGAVLGVIVLVLMLAIGWYLFLGPGAGQSSKPGDINVDVNLPTLAPTAPASS